VGCSVLFRSPRPTQHAIAQSYDEGTNYEHWQEQRELRERMWQRRLELVRAHKTRGRLLDVGTGDGHFLDIARRAGFETDATEVSRTGAAWAEKRGHRVHVGQLTQLDLPTETFDVITMWHVLEHVPDPGLTLRRARELMRSDGVLVLAVPNESNAIARWRLRPSRAESPFPALRWGSEIHLTHFQPSTLARAVRHGGFEPVVLGVDDVYVRRSLATWLNIAVQERLAHVLKAHLAMAMYVVCKPSERHA
jgi:2-polyprenyl-3-methyl-5-hydroxy-6-metoxy-1,4-benzoquinol methylase